MKICGYVTDVDEDRRCSAKATEFVKDACTEHYACPKHARQAHKAGASLECDGCGEVLQGMHELTDPWGKSLGWRCDNCNEAAGERANAAFYGGSGPRTIDEQCAAALRVKRGG